MQEILSCCVSRQCPSILTPLNIEILLKNKSRYYVMCSCITGRPCRVGYEHKRNCWLEYAPILLMFNHFIANLSKLHTEQQVQKVIHPYKALLPWLLAIHWAVGHLTNIILAGLNKTLLWATANEKSSCIRCCSSDSLEQTLHYIYLVRQDQWPVITLIWEM